MNIFVLDKSIRKIAEYHNNKHLVKMQLEYAQILSTVVRESGIDAGYKSTHKNHPCVKWALGSLYNWRWLRVLSHAMHIEWRKRFGHPKTKFHKSYIMVKSLPLPNIPDRGMTPFNIAVSEDLYIHGSERPTIDETILIYREYYRRDKSHLADWGNRGVPYWYDE